MARSIQAEAASMIRKHLKDHGVSAKVTSQSASMMTAVDISLKDALPATRKKVAEYANQFQYGHFDGMNDYYEYSNKRNDLPQVKYITVSCDYSDELIAAARDYVAVTGMKDDGYGLQGLYYRVLSGSVVCDFWTIRKPRQIATQA